MRPNQTLCHKDIRPFLTDLFGGELHAKRVLFLANATSGWSGPLRWPCIRLARVSRWRAV